MREDVKREHVRMGSVESLLTFLVFTFHLPLCDLRVSAVNNPG
jgi:hypothetical protein